MMLVSLKHNSLSAPMHDIKGHAAYDAPILCHDPSSFAGRFTNQKKKYIICVDHSVTANTAGKARQIPA